MSTMTRVGAAAFALAFGPAATAQADITIAHVYGQTGALEAYAEQSHIGLMLGIDAGAGCDGLVFRIERDRIEHETFVLFRREMIAEGYVPTWSMMFTDHGPVEALSFVADHHRSVVLLACGLGSDQDHVGHRAQVDEQSTVGGAGQLTDAAGDGRAAGARARTMARRSDAVQRLVLPRAGDRGRSRCVPCRR